MANSRQVGAHLQQRVRSLAGLELVSEVRGEGMLAAVELSAEDVSSTVVEAQRRIQAAGVMVRTQVDHLGIHPPLTFSAAEIDTRYRGGGPRTGGFPVTADHVEVILEQWARQRPDLDPAPIGIFGRISRIDRLFEQSMAEFLRPHGLTLGLFDVMAALRRRGEPFQARPSELAETVMLTSGGMTGRLDQLEQLGLVVRVADSDDRRVMLARLSAEGRALIDGLMAEHLDRWRRLPGGAVHRRAEGVRRPSPPTGGHTPISRRLRRLLAARLLADSSDRRQVLGVEFEDHDRVEGVELDPLGGGTPQQTVERLVGLAPARGARRRPVAMVSASPKAATPLRRR